MAQKYKVGDKVQIKSIDWYNENKDEHGNIDISHDFIFYAPRSKYCGRVFTIDVVFDNCYAVKEDNHEYYWADEMIECKVEEECPQDFIEKYCKSCGTQRCDRTKEYLEGCPYYNEYMSIKQNNIVEDKTIVDYVKESNDRYRIVIDPRFDIEVDEGEYYAVRRKKEYPKTYEECVMLLGLGVLKELKHYNLNILYKKDLIVSLQKLLICRDAYWQIAGEEMELGKPWVPDYTKDRYIICRLEDKILKGHRISGLVEHHIFEFPTTEMRDAFYENFKELIEQCKELL